MNNSFNEKERRIYADDLWIRMKKSWILLLVITLVCGILVDLLGYSRNSSRNEIHLDQTAAEIRAQLSDEEVRAVEKVLNYKQQLRSVKEYMDESVLLNMDALELPTEKLIYRSSASSSAVTRNCYEMLTEKQFLQKLADEIGWTGNAVYLAELINVEGVNEEKTVASPGMLWDGYVYISLYGASSQQAAKIADFVQSFLSTAEFIGGDSFTLVSRTQTVTIDTSLLEERTDLENVLTNITSTCSTAQAELSRLQKDLLAKEMTEAGFDEKDTEGIAAEEESASIVQPKYLALGLLLGLIIGVLVVMLRYMLSKNVRSTKDLQDLTTFDYVAHCTQGDAQAPALLTAYMQTFCEKRELHQVVLLAEKELLPNGTATVEIVRRLMEQGGIKTVFCTMDAQEPAVLKEILTAQCVLPVVEIDRTTCTALLQEMRICQREEIPAPACIVL